MLCACVNYFTFGQNTRLKNYKNNNKNESELLQMRKRNEIKTKQIAW